MELDRPYRAGSPWRRFVRPAGSKMECHERHPWSGMSLHSPNCAQEGQMINTCEQAISSNP